GTLRVGLGFGRRAKGPYESFGPIRSCFFGSAYARREAATFTSKKKKKKKKEKPRPGRRRVGRSPLRSSSATELRRESEQLQSAPETQT
ncbi:hypothetical protein EJB05_38554, partial [Eragrostis curvula]